MVATKESSITVQEFCRLGQFSWKHAYELASRQAIPAVKVDGRWRLSRKEAETYIAQHPKEQGDGNGK